MIRDSAVFSVDNLTFNNKSQKKRDSEFYRAGNTKTTLKEREVNIGT